MNWQTFISGTNAHMLNTRKWRMHFKNVVVCHHVHLSLGQTQVPALGSPALYIYCSPGLTCRESTIWMSPLSVDSQSPPKKTVTQCFSSHAPAALRKPTHTAHAAEETRDVLHNFFNIWFPEVCLSDWRCRPSTASLSSSCCGSSSFPSARLCSSSSSDILGRWGCSQIECREHRARCRPVSTVGLER